MNTIERTDKIDAYLAGTMSDAEKNEFERLLLDADSSLEDKDNLQNEMELQKEIIHAIRRRHFREMIGKEMAKIKEEDEHHQRVRKISIWSLSGGAITAIAAVMLLLLILAPVARQMQEYSNQYVSGIEVSALRGSDSQTQSLTDALLLMQNDQWLEAEQIIDNIYQQTDITDEQQQETYDEAEWLKAICLMHRGQAIRAKRMLNKIADSESPYSHRAKEILNAL